MKELLKFINVNLDSILCYLLWFNIICIIGIIHRIFSFNKKMITLLYCYIVVLLYYGIIIMMMMIYVIAYFILKRNEKEV